MGLFFTDEKSHPELNKLLIIVYLRRQAKSARYVLSIAYARLPSDNPSLYRVAASERFITQLRIHSVNSRYNRIVKEALFEFLDKVNRAI